MDRSRYPTRLLAGLTMLTACAMAKAQAPVDCEDAAAASAYAQDFRRELEAQRQKASKEYKTLMYALEALPIMTGGDRQAERHGLCIFGQKALVQLDAMDAASDAAWKLVQRRVQAYGREKAVAGF